MDRPTFIMEAGVLYRQCVGDETPPPDATVFEYTWLHIPSGKSGREKVLVLGGRQHMDRLLAHWNRTENWHYMG